MKSILAVFAATLSFTLVAQDLKQTVRGSVIDKVSREPLTGASVVVMNTEPLLVSVVDIAGNFRISQVPVGRYSIKVSYLGYNDIMLNDVIVNSAKEVVLNIEMQEKVNAMDELVVKARPNKAATNNELIQVSGRSFTVDQTMRYAGALGDPSRMAASFAGVAGGGNDQRNDIIIRGNSPLGLLWRVEGADIPNPNHFSNQGSNGGPISILNNNLLANSDFITGAFPSEYGNANSGVFDLRMRNGNNEKREFIGQIGFTGLELLAEGPIKKGSSSYLVSYRYSTLSFLGVMGITFGNSGVPAYQDLSFKFHFPKTKLGSISIWGLGGKSSTRIQDSKKDSAERAELAYPQDIDFSSRMGATGITHLLTLNKKTYIRSVLSVSGEGNYTLVDTLSPENRNFETYNANSRSSKLSLHSFLNHKFNARHSIKTGFILTRLNVRLCDSFYAAEAGRYIRESDFNENGIFNQVYINWNYRLTENLTFNSGLHSTYLFLNNTYSVEPRASMKWAFTGKQSLAFGYGLHAQTQPLVVYFTATLADSATNRYIETNRDLAMSKSHHFVLGYEFLVNENLRFKAETYYQYLYDLPVTSRPSAYSTVNFGADFGFPDVDSLVSGGQGRNYGLELTLEKFFSRGYYFLFTSSFYNSEYRASDHIWRNTAFNGNYVTNLLAGKEFRTKKNGIFAVNIKINYSGGRRVIPLDEAASKAEGKAIYLEDQAYEERLPAFFRTDIKLSFKKNGRKVTQEWAIDVQNVTNHQNVLARQYNANSNQVETLYQIGIFPVPFYRIYF